MLTKKYLSVEEVARRHGRSPRTIRDWIAHGCVTPNGRLVLPAIRAGKKLTIEIDDLEIFEARLRRAGSRPVDDPL
jgi:hypothetical protein